MRRWARKEARGFLEFFFFAQLTRLTRLFGIGFD